MPKKGDTYIVEVKPSHIAWGVYRKTHTLDRIEGESYVKIPSKYAREYNIKRGDYYTVHFENGTTMRIKASGNGPMEQGIQYAKQFEGIGIGACKAFTPWYIQNDVVVGDRIKITFLSPEDFLLEKI